MPHKVKILYVDDEVDNLKVLSAAFKHDFDIHTSISPIESLELAKETSFDIIIADQRMPEMTGVDYLEKVSEISESSVRIMLTGYSDFQAIIDAINRGKIFYYCSKPWKKEELKLVLLKAIEHFHLTQRNKDLITRLSATIKELETFLYRASHDLRSPITTQLGLFELLKKEVSGTGAIYIQKIEETIEKLQRILEKMNQLSNQGYEFLKQNLTSHLDSIVKASLARFKNEADFNHIKIESQLKENDSFYFDSVYTSAIIGNIIENAVNFRRKDVDSILKISNSFSSDQNLVEIEFEDNGIGIPTPEIDKVFDPFFRGTTISNGNGLGLYVVKKLCESLNGSVTATSDGKSWSKIKVMLPNAKNIKH